MQSIVKQQLLEGIKAEKDQSIKKKVSISTSFPGNYRRRQSIVLLSSSQLDIESSKAYGKRYKTKSAERAGIFVPSLS